MTRHRPARHPDRQGPYPYLPDAGPVRPPDRFGLDLSEGAKAQRAAPISWLPGWVPIRNLHARHRSRIVDHLLKLDQRDRYLRFGHVAAQAQICRYVAAIDFKRDEVFGVFDGQLQLVAVAHLAAICGQSSRQHGIECGPSAQRGGAMEFGVSVLPEARGQGLGFRLFEHAIVHARNRGAAHLLIHALSDNTPMLRLAAKAGVLFEHDGPETQAWIKLPPDTVGSHLDGSIRALAAELLYRVTYRLVHVGDWLRLMMTSG